MRRARALALLAVAVGLTLTAAAPAQARPRFDTRVFAVIPAPGFPASSLVAPDRTVYVGNFDGVASSSPTPSRVFAYTPEGTLTQSWIVKGQDLAAAHGVQAAATDPQGRLVLLDHHPSRALLLDPRTGAQTTYATFPDVPTCSGAPAGSQCSATLADFDAEPDYAAWGPDASLYVTDYTQGLIWRVPPGGGTARVWITDARLDGVQFGPAGIVLAADHRTLLFSLGGTTGLAGGTPLTGGLFRVPINGDGSAGKLQEIWQSRPAEAPDGFALAKSGNVYLALVGPLVNQLVEISPSGKELARFPSSPGSGDNGSPIPFDEPSSAVFDGTRLLVTNLSSIMGNASHQAILDVEVGEPGEPVYVPSALSPAQPPATTPQRKAKKKRRHHKKHSRHRGRRRR